MSRNFLGKVITNNSFENLSPRQVFYRQLLKPALAPDENVNSHILFRKKFSLLAKPKQAKLYITADDYYKVYINGEFIGQGPAPCYPDVYGFNVWDVTDYLSKGQNLIAVHTYYQGLVNRVWVSGDNRHGLLYDLEVDGSVIARSDESTLTHIHTAYSECGKVGYDTQFLERYDSNASEINFFENNFDDSKWTNSVIKKNIDYKFIEQTTSCLEFEKIVPVKINKTEKGIFLDFGKTYVGYLSVKAKGSKLQKLYLYFGQELNDDKSVRYNMRCNCNYAEEWILSGNSDVLNEFDYKSFRYAEIVYEKDCEITDIALISRHYPFNLSAKISSDLQMDKDINAIWDLCLHTQKYGVQEVIQDCMDREKGFYIGDGCYTALTHLILTGDDRMARKLIDDGFHSSFVSEGLLTCVDCSFCQEIAEYPLMLISFVFWHYQITGDRNYLEKNFSKAISVLDNYRNSYESEYLLCNLDKWCVVEWPKNFQDGYAVDIREGKICTEPHVSINAYYLQAIKTVNKIAEILGYNSYRKVDDILLNFNDSFYDKVSHRYVDGVEHRHISLIGNMFPFAFGLCDDEKFYQEILKEIDTRGIENTSLFVAFLLLMGLNRLGERQRMIEQIKRPNAWLNMIKEGATTTYEGWGKDSKWNTSLFHLTLSYVAIFISDFDVTKLII